MDDDQDLRSVPEARLCIEVRPRCTSIDISRENARRYQWRAYNGGIAGRVILITIAWDFSV